MTEKATDERYARTARVERLLAAEFGAPEPHPMHRLKPLAQLILALLSQNTTDKNCEAAYESLKAAFPASKTDDDIDWKAVTEAPTEKVAAAIRVGGLGNQKSERIQSLLNWVYEEYGEYAIDFICQMEPDKAIERFTTQKGVGVKTVCIVLCFRCGLDVFPVDTHVHRVCNRLGLVDAHGVKTPEKTFYAMRPMVPAGTAYTFHMNVIRLGRTICKARKPDCPACPLNAECDYAKSLT